MSFLDHIPLPENRDNGPLVLPWPVAGNPAGLVSFATLGEWRRAISALIRNRPGPEDNLSAQQVVDVGARLGGSFTPSTECAGGVENLVRAGRARQLPPTLTAVEQSHDPSAVGGGSIKTASSTKIAVVPGFRRFHFAALAKAHSRRARRSTARISRGSGPDGSGLPISSIVLPRRFRAVRCATSSSSNRLVDRSCGHAQRGIPRYALSARALARGALRSPSQRQAQGLVGFRGLEALRPRLGLLSDARLAQPSRIARKTRFRQRSESP
jgi:hypothetical protein